MKGKAEMLEPNPPSPVSGETEFLKREHGSTSPSASGGPSSAEVDPLGSEELSAAEAATKVKNEILREWISDTVSANKFFKIGDEDYKRISKTLKNGGCQNIVEDPMEVRHLYVTPDIPELDSDSDSDNYTNPVEKADEGEQPISIEVMPTLNTELLLGGETQIRALKNQGCCKRECTKYFSVEELLTYNLESKNLDYKVNGMNLLDLTILGQMRGMCRTLDHVKSGKTSKEKVRERLRMICTLGGVSVCEKVFLLANGIKIKRFKRLLKNYKLNGLRPSFHGNCRKIPKIPPQNYSKTLDSVLPMADGEL